MEEIIELFDKTFTNLNLRSEIYDQDFFDSKIYLMIYKALFPFLS